MRTLAILLLALALAACQSEQPAGTSTVRGEATAPRQPAETPALEVTDEPEGQGQPAEPADEAGWERAEWAGLSIPIPPDHVGQELQMEDQTINGAPVLDSFTIAFDRAQARQGSELPSGFLMRVVEFSQGPEEWVRLTSEASPLSVEAATVRESTVAGRPALVYNPSVTGTGKLQNYVVRLDERLLLLIDTDIAYEGYDSVILGIRG